MSYTIKQTLELENEDHAMCVQTTVWSNMTYGEMLGLEMYLLDSMAQMPRTLGAEKLTAAVSAEKAKTVRLGGLAPALSTADMTKVRV